MLNPYSRDSIILSSWLRFFTFVPRGRRIPAWLSALLLITFSCAAQAQSGPQIVSVTPADGATGLNTNTAVVIVFDRDMDVSVTPFGSIPPAIIGNFDIQPSTVSYVGVWSLDKRTLTLQPIFALPFDTEITWRLNPPGNPLFGPLASAEGDPVEMVSGSFRTRSNVAAGPAPKVVSVTPPDGAVDVSPGTDLVVVFDLEMNTNVTLTPSIATFVGNFEMGPGTIAFQFQGQWGADRRTLTFKNIAPLPQNTQVTWKLNPPGTTAPLTSATGQSLATTNWSYRVVANTGGNTNEICITNVVNTNGMFTINKSFAHNQISASEVVPHVAPAAFTVLVQSPPFAGNPVTNGSFTYPSGVNETLTNLVGNLVHVAYPESEAALEASYPAGNYTMRFKQQGLPERTVQMSMPATFPSVPTILNYDAAQAIDPSEPFLLQWNAFSPHGEGSYITVFIIDEFGNTIFQAPNICLNRQLTADDTSVLIPANYFKKGMTYTGTLLFGTTFYLSTNTIPQMHGYGALMRTTSFTLKAIGNGGSGPGDLARATFTAHRLLNGNPQMTLSGTPLGSYKVQRASALPNGPWLEVGTVIMDGSGVGTFEDTSEPLPFPAFYRAVPNPGP